MELQYDIKSGPRIKVMKSTFVGSVIEVSDEQTARSIVKDIKQSDRKARHVVFAFRIAGNPVSEGMSDDGEPRGTGGFPILNILRGRDITNILVTVTRYWGGVKLGPGRLKRAYKDAAQEAIDMK
ncbi:MAG: YigZ family protein [Candidatus Latescibacteria bacterium]|nr:YigZ family protein [Candidatus Latescibacterota bacterium]